MTPQPTPEKKSGCVQPLLWLVAAPFLLAFALIYYPLLGLFRVGRWWIGKISSAKTTQERNIWIGVVAFPLAGILVLGLISAAVQSIGALFAGAVPIPTTLAAAPTTAGEPAAAAATAARVATARASDPTSVPTLDATAARVATARASDPTATTGAAATVQRPSETRAPATATRRPATAQPTRTAPARTQIPSATRVSSAAQVPTRTAAPTAVPPTATSTAAPTEVPPTAEPTAEPTAVPPTVEPPTEVPPTAEPTAVPTAEPPTAVPTATGGGGGGGGASASCTDVTLGFAATAPNSPLTLRVDKVGETVTVTNVSGGPVDVSGWYVCSLTGSQLHAVLSGTIGAGASELILSQAGSNIWNNSTSDPGVLLNAAGVPVAYWAN